MSDVVFKLVEDPCNVINDLAKALNLVKWENLVSGKKVFIKPNFMSKEVLPGRCTSPWIIEAVLKLLRDSFSDLSIYIGDCEATGARQFDKAIKNWGILEIAKKYEAQIVNLSRDKQVYVTIESDVLDSIDISQTVLDADVIVNMPVLKTHCLTTITGALKNHWGLLPKIRYNFHPYADEVIASINRFFQKTKLNIMDGTICIEKNGPRVGIPKICNVIVVSSDRVAMDACAANYMGIDPKTIEHIVKSEKKNVGTSDFNIIGDEFFVNNFIEPDISKDFVMRVEMGLRKIPFIKFLVFKTKFFDIPAWFGAKYNSVIWFNFVGKKYVKNILTSEYGELLKKYTNIK